MRPYAHKVKDQLARGYIESNRECAYYPCHYKGQNCTLCYCPFYPCEDESLGKYITGRKGNRVWSCKDCFWIHRDDVAKVALPRLMSTYCENMADAEARAIKKEVKRMHPVRGSAVMVLGTTSGAGKSLIVTALCRIFSDMEYSVSPYKSQNMSLNSFVTPDGEEISRIQDLQARAARARPNGHMNPLLLKPKRDDVSQVIICGMPYKDMDVPTYYGTFVPCRGKELLASSVDAILRMYDIVVMEGAGSPAEINLGDGDIANLAPAELADAPCILVVNVERGGSFAYVYGTISLLEKEHGNRIKGVIYNNMHGDAAMLEQGIKEIEEKIGVPCLGVVPHIDLSLPSEDSQSIRDSDGDADTIVAVIRFPRIANFTDFDAFTLEDGVGVRYVDTPAALADADIIILPGTKHTLGDLAWLRERGLDKAIQERRGVVPIIGICGGYQMMGKEVHDSGCIESSTPTIEKGLGIFDTITHFKEYEKETVQVEGTLCIGSKGELRGYEIHMGTTDTSGCRPLCRIAREGGWAEEGVADEDMLAFGTYLHGIFDLPTFRRHVLSLADTKTPIKAPPRTEDERIEAELDKLADVVRQSVDISALCAMMGVEFRHG